MIHAIVGTILLALIVLFLAEGYSIIRFIYRKWMAYRVYREAKKYLKGHKK